VTESTFVFGSERNLVGTLTMPDGGAPHPIAFILPNAGVIHRIGPHRINVKLARHLAARGYACLRFDTSGLGDSARARADAAYEVRVVEDLQSALDAVTEVRGVRCCAIVGICSGAENGFAAALADQRIVGLVMIDGYAYPTAKTRWHRYARRLRDGPVATVTGWIKRRLQTVLDANASSDVTITTHAPAPVAFARMVQQLIDRDVAILTVHTGSFLRRYSYASQFREAFAEYPFVSKVRCEFIPEIDHTITSLSGQARVLQLVSQWATSLDRSATEQH